MKSKILLIALATTALASCSNDEVVSVQQNDDAIEFRTLMNNSRATETTTSNLNEFWVSAFKEDWTYEFQDQEYVRGSGNASNWFYISGSAQKTWPKNTLRFFAINPDHTLNIDIEGKPRLVGFEPAAKIRAQEDLIYATNEGSRSTFATSVPLKFNHALAEVEIWAKNTSSSYTVHVRGYRIGYVDKKGTFTFPEAVSHNDTTAIASFVQADGTWSDLSTKGNYSSEFLTGTSTKKGILLGETAQRIYNNVSGDVDGVTYTTEGTAMVLPQDGGAWTPESGAANGRYLAVLVSVDYPDGTSVYPADSKTTGKRVSYAGLPYYYAYAAVPISEKWEAGKKYTYVLDFSNGCGYVDPEQPDGYIPTDSDGDGTPDGDEDGDGIPDDNDGDGVPDGPGDDDTTVPDSDDPFGPGDPIIGHSIIFKVIVSDWQNVYDPNKVAGMNSTITGSTTPAGTSSIPGADGTSD